MKKKPKDNEIEIRLALESPALTVKEAAVFAHVPPNRIRDLIASGALSFQEQGKRFLILKSDLVELLQRGWRRNSAENG